MTSRRANGEGSIFPYRNGFAAYVWITTPSGKRQRRYVYGRTREIVHSRWVELTRKAARGPVVTKVPTVGQFLRRWLEDTVAPNLAPLTYATYESHVKNYIEPGIGALRLDHLRVADVQTWLNRLATQCRCCAQEKDVRRAFRGAARCCALGKCCHQVASPRTIKDVRTVLRSALHSAVRQELIDRNVAQLVEIPSPRRTGARWPPTSRPTRNGCWPSSPAGSARRRLANEGSDPVLRWMRFDARRPPSRPEKSSLTPASTAGIAGGRQHPEP